MTEISVLDQGRRVFVASSDVAPQRKAAYAYCELTPKGTRQAIPLPSGGELHLADGGIIPIDPWDWVVEQPNGQLISISSEEIADHWDFADGPDDFREAHEKTCEYVKHARQAPRKNPPIKVVNELPADHPDHGPAIEAREQERTADQLQAAYLAQAQKAREQLQVVVNVATKRGLVTDDEAQDWLDLGVQPEHIEVRFDQVLGTYQVARVVPEANGPEPGDGGSEAEGDAPAPSADA